MCGNADDAVYPASRPIVLLPPRTGSLARPRTSEGRPRTSRGSVVWERPAERPAVSRLSIVRQSPTLSRTASIAGSLTISQRGGFTSSLGPSVTEDSEDRPIIRHVINLAAYIERLVRYFYTSDDSSGANQYATEFASPQTRHAAISQYISKEIIDSRVMVDENDVPDIPAIIGRISAYRKPDLNSDAGRYESDIRDLCEIGDQLRECIKSHASDWKFRSWDEPGFIILVPALLKNGKQIVPQKRVRLS